MSKAVYQRTVVLGNCGAGKSWLSERLSDIIGAQVIDLDTIRWERRGQTRPKDIAHDLVKIATAGERWIIEGVHGDLCQIACQSAEAVIWLDMPRDQCIEGIAARGARRGATELDFAAALDWAGEYWTRSTSSSFFGHSQIFSAFQGEKNASSK